MSDAKPKIVIKKYENRRLYDSAQSRYVNLEDIAAMIRDGHDVQVVDAKSAEDLTRTILTQIIVDESKGKESGLPIDLLKQMIVSSQQARHQFLEWYFKSAIETFERMQAQMLSFQAPFGVPAAGASVPNPLDAMMNLFRGVPGSVPFLPFMPFQQPVAAAAPIIAPENDVAELKRRLEDLERQVAAKPEPNKRKD